jgi:sn1-specific diacylglycerol lipase
MSLNEIAVDLTCEYDSFQPASTPPPPSPTDDFDDEETPIPGTFAFPTISEKEVKEEDGGPPQYQVHGGMLKLARAMGEIGKPVHLAVLEALCHNPDYGGLIDTDDSKSK